MKTGHIYLYGIFGKPDIFDAGPSITLPDVVAEVKKQGQCDRWLVHIHSDGGDYNEGMAIFDYLKSLPNCDTINEGKCYSIASVALLAGTKRIGRPNCDTLIHNPWGRREGDADQMQQYSEQLRQVENTLQSFYSTHTGAGTDTIAKMMKQTTAMKAAEALQLGFLTEISETVEAYAHFTPEKKPITVQVTEKETKMSIVKTVTDSLNRLIKNLSGEPIKNLLLTLTDGSKIFIDTEADRPAEGDMCKIGGADGPDAPDGDHTLSDGTVITTASGKITKITEPSTDEPMDQATKDMLEGIQNSLKTLTEKVEGFETEISNLKTTQEEIKNLAEGAKEEKKEAEAILNKVQDVAKTINSVYTPERIAALNKWTEEQGEKKDSKTERLIELAKKEKEKRTATV